MLSKEECNLLGKLTKSHGIHGETVLKLGNILLGDIKEMESVFVEIDGLLVPFFIEYYHESNPTTLLIKFVDRNSIEDITDLLSCNLFIEKKFLHQNRKQQNESLEDLVNYDAFDEKTGKIGKILDYLPVKNNPLFSIQKSGKEVLIPATKDFIQSIDKKQMIVFMSIPDELLNL